MKKISFFCLLCLVACGKEQDGPEFRSRSEGALVATIQEKTANYVCCSNYIYDSQRRIAGIEKKVFGPIGQPWLEETIWVRYAPGKVLIIETSPDREGSVQTVVRLGRNGLMASATRHYFYEQMNGTQIRADETCSAHYGEADELIRFSHHIEQEKNTWYTSSDGVGKYLYEKGLEDYSHTTTYEKSTQNTLRKSNRGERQTFLYRSGWEQPYESRTSGGYDYLYHFSAYRNSTNIDFTARFTEEVPGFPAAIGDHRLFAELGLTGNFGLFVPEKADDLNYGKRRFEFSCETDREGLLRKVTCRNVWYASETVWEITYMD